MATHLAAGFDPTARFSASVANEGVGVVASVVAGLVAFAFSIVLTRLLLERLTRMELFQPINLYVTAHASNPRKAQVPTMGGAAVVTAAVIGVVAGCVTSSDAFGAPTILVLLGTLVAGATGLADDLLKVRRARPTEGSERRKVNEGITTGQKMLGVVGTGLIVGLGSVAAGIGDRVLVPFADRPLTLSPVAVVVLAIALVAATTNAVNMTDGLDGLAGGSCVLTFGALALMAFWMFRHAGYEIEGALGLTVVAGAFATACAGYLWWNMYPASVMMGDAGALAFGAAIAVLTLALGLTFLLPFLGGLFLIETLSSMTLIFWVRVLQKRPWLRRFGFIRRNPFKAPIHHEFQQRHQDEVVRKADVAWAEAVRESPELATKDQPRPPNDNSYEPTLVMRLWLFHAVCVAAALALFYGDWLVRSGS